MMLKSAAEKIVREVSEKLGSLETVDPEIFEAIAQEENRQRDKIELIASENYVSRAVLEAVGSVLTNKYAEGYPGKRYYGGCEYVDIAENLAIARAKDLFGAGFVNVQPHSGAQANMAAYAAILKPGDKILGMSLDMGGHLTHGTPMNASGKLYQAASYGVDRETERLNYDEIERLAKEFQPQVIVAGASAYSRAIDFARFRAIADSVDAKLMVDMAHIAGLVAAGLHPNPIPHAHVTTSTTHKTLRGPRGGLLLTNDEEIAELLNKAVFPGQQGGPLMHIIAAKAVAFKEALQPEFKTYQQRIINNARAMAATLKDEGLRIVSGGTDNHLMLVDLNPVEISGKKAQLVLDEANVTVNKNAIPYDTRSPFVTSGIRVGTPAVTSRGFGEQETVEVGRIIGLVIKSKDDPATMEAARERVAALVARFPVPGLDF